MERFAVQPLWECPWFQVARIGRASTNQLQDFSADFGADVRAVTRDPHHNICRGPLRGFVVAGKNVMLGTEEDERVFGSFPMQLGVVVRDGADDLVNAPNRFASRQDFPDN